MAHLMTDAEAQEEFKHEGVPIDDPAAPDTGAWVGPGADEEFCDGKGDDKDDGK